MIGEGRLGSKGGRLLGECFFADVTEGRQLDLTGLDQRLQSRQVGVNGNVTEADEANTSRGHG
jgi:hypothetical protein